MRTLLAAVALWTLFAVWLVLVDPGGGNVVADCMRLVSRSEACELQQARLDDVRTMLHTAPLLVAIALGYVVIVALHVRSRRP